MKSLLVIGGTGFIGYHVISEAKKRDIRFIVYHYIGQKTKEFTKA